MASSRKTQLQDVSRFPAHREIYRESGYIKPNTDCNYTFPIDLASNVIPFAVLNQLENGK